MHDDARLLDDPGRKGEALVRADEVEHSPRRLVDLFWRTSLVGAELEGSVALPLGDVDGDDARVGQELHVLHRELTEAAHAEHDRGGAVS